MPRLPLDVREGQARAAIHQALAQLRVAVQLADDCEYSGMNVVYPLREARDAVAAVVEVVEGRQ